MSALVFQTSSEEETIELGRSLAPKIHAPKVVLLTGDLGAGKTTLTKGLVEGFGIGGSEVSSPTFTLIHEYGMGLYHVDLYRLDTIREVETLGLEDMLDRQSILFVEWGDRFPMLWPDNRVKIEIQDLGGDRREIKVSGLS